MDKNPVFQTFSLTKSYKGFKAVDAVSMNIYEGDVYGFVGENGAGKTTLIRLACGLIHETSGEYALFGVLNTSKEIVNEQKKLAAIVESVAVNRGMSALDNLRLQAKIAGIEKSDEELNKLIDEVGLDHKAIEKKKAGSFSPKFILLDEPMNGLDPQGFVDMRETILRLNKLGVTFLISSHILSELDKICTRVGFLSHGKLLTELSIDELHDKTRRKISIRVKDADDVSEKLVKNFDIKESKVEGENIIIYDALDINEVMAFLVSKKIKVEGISSSEETIEDFYRELMNGEVKQ